MDINGWRQSMAHIWLASAISIREDHSIVHVGSGEGHACFALALRVPVVRIYGIAWSRDEVRKATEFVRLQQWHGRVEIVYSDGRSLPPRLAAGTFEQAMIHWTGESPPELIDQMNMTLMMLKPHGIMTILCEPTWLSYMLPLWKDRVGNVNLFPLWFHGRDQSDYTLIQAQKNTPDTFTLHKGFRLNEEGGSDD